MNNTLKHIAEQLDIMSYLNVLSFSVLSGCGTSVAPSLHDLDAIEELCLDMPPNQKPYNIFFMNSLYKKAMPTYAREIENPYNYEGYQWVDKKRKEIIDIQVMACSIIGLCSLVERLITGQIQLENSPFMTFVLFKTAYHQAKFIKHYLKIGDIYYSGEDISDDSKDIHIQIAPKNPDILSQLSVLQSFIALRKLASYNIPYIYLKEDEFLEDLDLLQPLYSNIMEHISSIKSKDLANIGLCIADIYVKADVPSRAARGTLDGIGQELLRRLNSEGEVVRTGSEIEGSSPAALFNSLNLLSQLYYMFGGKSYNHACLKIYSRLESIWDGEHRIFKFKDSNKQAYSIKDIAAIISALFSLYCTVSEHKLAERLEEQITGLYETCIIKSHIFTGQTQPILQQCAIFTDFVSEEAIAVAPVFSKTFEYKISKDKFYCDADVFRADYVLPACCMLLNSISNYYM